MLWKPRKGPLLLWLLIGFEWSKSWIFKICRHILPPPPPHKKLFLKAKEKKNVFIESIYSFWQRWSFLKRHMVLLKQFTTSPSPNQGGRVSRCFYLKCRCASLEGGCPVPEEWAVGIKWDQISGKKETKRKSKSMLMSVQLLFLLLSVWEVIFRWVI